VAPASQGRIETGDEHVGRQSTLGVFEHAAPFSAQAGVDAAALPVFVDQLVAIGQPRHELAWIEVQDVHAFRPVVDRMQHAEALQVDQRVVAVLAVARAAEVHAADGCLGQHQARCGVGPLDLLAVEAHWHGEAGAQRGDARGQLGQVDAVELDLGPCRRRFGQVDDIDRRSGQRRGGVEVGAQATRSHDAARRGIQALREADAERVLRVARGFIPARLVEGQQLLEVVDAAAVVSHGQRAGLGVVVDDDGRGACAPCVLEQFRHEGESVGEGEALIAQRAFLVDADLNLHGESPVRRVPPKERPPWGGCGSTARRVELDRRGEELAGMQGLQQRVVEKLEQQQLLHVQRAAAAVEPFDLKAERMPLQPVGEAVGAGDDEGPAGQASDDLALLDEVLEVLGCANRQQRCGSAPG
jgi:hypothetical protein